MQITNHPIQGSFSHVNEHSIIDTKLRQISSENKLPNVALLHYANMWFNLYNDPTLKFQPSLAVKWQLLFVAHSKRIDEKNILIGENFDYTYLSGKDVASLFFILNSFQTHEKNANGEQPIFPDVVSFFERYIVRLCDKDEAKARQILDALISYENPSLSGIIERMRDKLINIAKKNGESNEKFKKANPTHILNLPPEILEQIIVLTGDQHLTSRISQHFRLATIKAAASFLKLFNIVEIPAIQRLLVAPVNETYPMRYERLKEVYQIFIRSAEYTIPREIFSSLASTNLDIANALPVPLNHIKLINDIRQDMADRKLINFCRNSFFIRETLLNAIVSETHTQDFTRLLRHAYENYGFIAFKLLDSPEINPKKFHQQNFNLELFFQTLNPRPLNDVELQELINTEAELERTLVEMQALPEELNHEDANEFGDFNLQHMIQDILLDRVFKLNEMLRSIRRKQYLPAEAKLLRKHLEKNQAIAQMTPLIIDVSIVTPIVMPADLLRYCKNLKLLTISNQATSSLPDEITEVVGLQTLVIKNCHWIHSLPQGMKNLQNLGHLQINGSRITSFPLEILEIPNLKVLDLQSNHVITSLPSGIGRLTQLEHLKIDGTGITSLPPEIKELKNLKALYIHTNQIPEAQLTDLQTAIPGLIIIRS